MITCIINGLAAYPAEGQSIKITLANQYVSDDGEYSYDINFPMSVMANRRVFHNVSRFDVKKTTRKYDECKLYAGARLVLSGVGTIISVSESEIKLQIVGGKSRIKFNEKMTKHYIDELDLGTAPHPGYDIGKGLSQLLTQTQTIKDIYYLYSDLKPDVLGWAHQWCFVPVRDETNDMIANFIGVDRTGTYIGRKEAYIQNCAVQPNLMYIFKKIVEYEGYKIERNDFDCEPWNNLYIASAFKSLQLRSALPHWSCYTFIEEFRKLFNATIYFDDIKKTCKVIKVAELSQNDLIEIQPLDEYTTDYDEDGSFNTSATANLQYNLGNAAGRGDYESIPQKVLNNFDIVYAADYIKDNGQFATTTQGWTEKKKRQTIIKNFSKDYYIYVEDENGNNKWQMVGFWSPLMRDTASEDFVDLNISPAAQVVEDVNFRLPGETSNNYEKRCLLSIPNDKECNPKDCDTDDDGYSYVSVQDALDDDSVLDTDEDTQECLNIFFLLPDKWQCYNKPQGQITDIGQKSWWHQFTTDYRINPEYINTEMSTTFVSCSLSLNADGTGQLGELHKSTLKVDKNNCLQVRFRANNIPNPSANYIIKGKKFICEKIEVDIKDDGIDPICTGYFYMMS